MSKLTTLVRRITRYEPAPMGFGSSSRTPAPTMALVALVSEHYAQGVADAVAAGADALLLAGKPNDSELAEAVAAAEETACGLLTNEADVEKLAQLSQAGLDFLAVGTGSPASALQQQDLGIVLHLTGEFTDIQLRTIDALSVEALYADNGSAPMTIQRQMELQRLTGLTRKPLLLRLPAATEEEDLLCLREASAPLVVIDMQERNALDELRRLRGVVDALPPRKPPAREDSPGVLVPQAVAQAPSEDDDEREGTARMTPIRRRSP